MQKAIIYCRVSSERQVKEGHGLDSQEKRCRSYARQQGYKVLQVFHEKGISGGVTNRPIMNDVLTFLEHQNETIIVIVDDIKRFARNVEGHFILKQQIYSRNGKLESPTHRFEDSPEGKFVETIIASAGELERNQNARQVKNRMKARVEAGYWPFCYPPGLINKSHPVHGKILSAHEPVASVIIEAFEQFRDGILQTQEQVCFFIEARYRKLGINKKISLNGTKRILTNPLYAGYIKYEDYGVPLQKAKHEGIITKETFDIVQIRLKAGAKAALRTDYNEDFPLRGFIVCSECKKAMTASWHKGRNVKYPHYFCKNPVCPRKDKNIRRDDIESAFLRLLEGSRPNPEVMSLVSAILTDIWQDRALAEVNNYTSIRKRIEDLQSKKSLLIERITSAGSKELIPVYEEHIQKLMTQIRELEESANQQIYTNKNFGTASDIVITRVGQPVRMWQSKNYKDKRMLLEMYFAEKLVYDVKSGFGTADLAPLVKLLAIKDPSKNHLVEMAGVEPASEETRLRNV